jgi:hypothetical protein
METRPSHKLVLVFVFGREEEWSTKTVYGIGAQTVYMLCCLSVCVGVLATVSGQQMVHCSGLTSPTKLSYHILLCRNIKNSFYWMDEL